MISISYTPNNERLFIVSFNNRVLLITRNYAMAMSLQSEIEKDEELNT